MDTRLSSLDSELRWIVCLCVFLAEWRMSSNEAQQMRRFTSTPSSHSSQVRSMLNLSSADADAFPAENSH